MAGARPLRCGLAEDPDLVAVPGGFVAATVGDQTEVLDVHADHVPGGVVFIAADHPPAGPVQPGQLRQPVPTEDIVHGGGMAAQQITDPGRPQHRSTRSAGCRRPRGLRIALPWDKKTSG